MCEKELDGFRFAIYLAIGIFLIDCLMYGNYSLSPDRWVNPDLIFLYRFFPEGTFPLDGFAYIIVIGFFSGFFSWLIFKYVSGLIWQNIYHFILFVGNTAFYLCLMPFSVTMTFMYLAISVTVIVVIIFRHPLYSYPRIYRKNRVFPRDSRPLVEAVSQTHQFWATIFRDSLVIIVAYILVGGLSLVSNPLIKFFPDYSVTDVSIYTFARIQMVSIILILLYCAVGLLIWITSYSLRKMISSQKELNNLADISS